MFGLFYGIGMAIGAAISGTKCFIENAESKYEGEERAKKGKNLAYTYFDRKGVERDIRTDKIADVRPDINDICDDKYLWIGAPSVKTRNISAEQREIDYQNGKSGNWLGRTADLYDRRRWSTCGYNKYKTEIVGSFYKDLQTDEIFVCREFKVKFNTKENKYEYSQFIPTNSQSDSYRECKFYINIKTGLIVRKADTQLKKEKDRKYIFDMSDKECEHFIKEFNQAQKEGGWYHSDHTFKLSHSNESFLKQQDFYCNDLEAIDHIYNLVEMRKKLS